MGRDYHVSDRRVALDMTVARLGRAGPHVYITELARALAPLLGERLQPIASRFAAPTHARRTAGDRLRTLGRDLWWHQVGVERAARQAAAALLHLPAGIGPVRRGLPTVLTIYDLNVLRFPQLFRRWFRYYASVVLPRAARSADAIITLSHTSKADIVERLAIPAERVSVVPTGIHPSFTPIAPQSESAREVRRRYGLPPAFVLTVGSVEPRKNLPRLLEAIHQLRARAETADIVLVHAGPEGWLADGLYPSIRALGLSDVVRFLGYVPRQDLTALYGLARLCAYPSLSGASSIRASRRSASATGRPTTLSKPPSSSRTADATVVSSRATSGSPNMRRAQASDGQPMIVHATSPSLICRVIRSTSSRGRRTRAARAWSTPSQSSGVASPQTTTSAGSESSIARATPRRACGDSSSTSSAAWRARRLAS